MCVIKMTATYTFCVPASLWRTMTVSPLLPHTIGMHPLLSKCTLGQFSSWGSQPSSVPRPLHRHVLT